MVVNLSYKLTHLAQSFRPHHHFNTIRNAFPSTTTPVGFDFTSNVFGTVGNAASNAGGSVTLGVAAGALGAGAGAAAGAGAGGAAGGAGGSSAKAGSWASQWGFQTGKNVTQGQASQADSQLSDDADDLRSLATSHRTLLRRQQSRLPRSAAPLAFRARRGSLSQPARHPDLVRADEAGLSSIRLSGAEMQKRYHSAVARGGARAEDTEAAREADEVDLENNTDVLRSRRRASISNRPTMTLASPFVITTTPLSRTSVPVAAARGVHTSTLAPAARASTSSTSPRASSSFAAAPPSPSVPRVRRNSTSALPSSSEPLVDLPPPRAASPYRNVVRERRPPSSNPGDPNDVQKLGRSRQQSYLKTTQKNREEALDPVTAEHRDAILTAEKTGKPPLVERAVQQYLADPTKWTTAAHNVAIAALHRTRKPNDPLDRIVQLYNQLFDSERLSPNRLSYELVLKAFCVRDGEVRDMIRYIEKRQKKKELAAAARGEWDYVSPAGTSPEDVASAKRAKERDDERITQRERERLEALRGPEFDYFAPAVQIFEALGPLGDRLHSHVPTLLLYAAAGRGDAETALSLFERMEKSKHQRPGVKAYQALLHVYGEHEKDPAAVRDVFESYLAARASGAVRDQDARPAKDFRERPVFRPIPTKHRHTTEPDYAVDADLRYKGETVSGDELIAATTVKALFDAGDATGARALLDRFVAAQASSEPRQPGFPESFAPRTVASIVTGFISSGDEAAAREWWDRTANAPRPVGLALPDVFYSLVFYSAINHNQHELVNHVYRTLLSHVDANLRLSISELVTVIDYNLARSWKAPTPEERNAALDACVEFRAGFERAAKAGFLVGDLGPDFTVSTGLLGRIAQAMGTHGRYAEAAATFVSYANIVRAILRRLPEDDELAKRAHGGRSRREWVLRLTGIGTGALGFRLRPSATGASGVTLEAPAQDALPAVQDAVKVVGWTNKFRHVVGWEPVYAWEVLVVESYLASRAAAGGDATALGLTGDEWFTVIEASAHVAARANTGHPHRFEVPGFELAFEDFLRSGAEIPIGNGNRDYERLYAALRTSGMKSEQVLDVVDRLSRQHVQAPAEPEPEVSPAAAKAAAAEVVEEEDAASSLASESLGPATSATAPSVAEESAAASEEAPAQFPTPPSTPPAYLAELPAESQPAVADFDGISRQMTERLDNFVLAGKVQDALAFALKGAQEGRLAHPDAYGRLVEQLGRQHRVAEARQVYLVAYQALGAMANVPEQQSVAWVLLEDRMIVALAQAGELVDVGHHRDRLLQAGCAPSADAYAAMILNMKDTTDDAAVALTLFEESQRLNVRPNVYLFNTLISKLSRARRAKDALEYFELMKQYGLRPSSITYGAIINACCKIGDDASAAHLFQEMVSDPAFKPRVPPYNTMIQYHTSTRPDRERALHYYGQLVKAKVPPTGHTYKLLLDAYGTIGEPDLEMCQRIFTQLCQHRGVSVSGAHWASLITAYGINARQLDRAIAIFDSIAAHPTSRRAGAAPQPDAVVYEALLNVLIAHERADLCDQYLDEMRRRGVRMTAYVGNTLIKGYTQQGLYDRARAIFLAMAEPAAGVASAGNHPVDRHPKHHHQAAQQPAGVDEPTFREPSTYEAMIRCELAAGETVRAAEVLRLAEARAFPPAVIGRLRKLLAAEGIEALPLGH
ncbi:hypothetical protein JCM10450v2_003165 [Rhodotorula kratochvilovae]